MGGGCEKGKKRTGQLELFKGEVEGVLGIRLKKEEEKYIGKCGNFKISINSRFVYVHSSPGNYVKRGWNDAPPTKIFLQSIFEEVAKRDVELASVLKDRAIEAKVICQQLN